MSTDYQYYVILLFCFSYLYSKTDSQFTEAPDSPIVKCFGDTANVRWNFSVMNIQSIQWFDGSTEMMIKFAASAPTYSNSYNSSVVEYVADAEILLKALTTSSTGSYSCTLFYTTGSPITNTIDLIVYDKFSSGLICQYVGGAITCTKPDSSVSLNATDDQGSVIDINKPSTSGNYTICMYGGAIECRDTFPTCTIVEVIIQGPTSQITILLTTASVNNIMEYSKATPPMNTGGLTSTTYISTSTTSNLNTETAIFDANTETTNFYSNTETTNPYVNTETIHPFLNTGSSNSFANTETTNRNANIETSNPYTNTEATTFYGNTVTYGIQKKTLVLLSYTMSTGHGILVTPVENHISGFFPPETSSLIITESFASPCCSISLYNEVTLPSTFETTSFFSQSFSETFLSEISYSVESQSDIFFSTLHVRSNSLIKTDPSKYSVLSIKISSSFVVDPEINPFSMFTNAVIVPSSSFSSYQSLSKFDIQSNEMSSSIPENIKDFLNTTTILITYNPVDTDISMKDLTGVFQTFSQAIGASVSTSVLGSLSSIDNNLLLQASQYHTTMQTELTSYVTTSFSESNIDHVATGIYSTKILTSGKSYMHISASPSETQFGTWEDIQDSTSNFQSINFKPYSQSTDKVFLSTKMSEHSDTIFQSTSFLFPVKTKATVTAIDSDITTTNMRKIQSGILITDRSLIKNHATIQISADSSDFETTWLTTSFNIKNRTIPSLIKHSSQQTNSDSSYIENDMSLKDTLLSLKLVSESLKTYDPEMTSLTSGVLKPTSTLPSSTKHSGLSEKTTNAIFIITTSVVLAIIAVILLITMFAKMELSKDKLKPRKEEADKSLSYNMHSLKTGFPDFSLLGKNIHPLLNTSSTSSTSFTIHPYKHNWDDTV